MIIRIVRLRLCLFVLLFISTLSARRLPIQVFTVANGMPRNSARCLVPDPTGLLWICTSEGLVRFDGYQFRVFGPEHGLPSRSIFDFVVSKKGGYWLVTDLGVCRLPPGSRIGDRCVLLEVDNPLGEFQSQSLVEARDGSTWVATSKAVFRMRDDGRKLERAAFPTAGEDIHALAEAPDGSMLVGTETAVYQWSKGRPARNIIAGLAPHFSVTQIYVPSPGEVWLATTRGLFRMTGWQAAQPPLIEAIQFAHPRFMNRLISRRDGTIWTAGSAGISHLELTTDGQASEVEQYSPRDGLPDATIERLAEDRQGNLWGSTESGAGIFRIVNSGVISYYEDDGLGSARIASIFEDLQGHLCVFASERPARVALRTAGAGNASAPSNFRVKNGSHFERIDIRYPPGFYRTGWGWNQFGLQARDGEWWIPTGAGLFRFPKAARPQQLAGRAPAFIYDTKSALGEDEVFRTFEDAAGDIWISTLTPKNELIRWERKTGTFRHWNAGDGWPLDAAATALRQAPSGDMWIGTFEEIVRFRNGRFEVVPILPKDQPAYVRDVYIDRGGRVWVATSRYGLYRCDNPDAPAPVFRTYTTREGLSSNSVRAITEDDAGFIYAGTVRGLDRIDPREPLESHRIRHFGAAEGFPDNEHNVAYRDRQGHLWFGTLDGLAEFDPSKAERLSPPEVYVTRVRVRGEDIPLPWEGARSLRVDLTADKNQFEIEYAGVDLRSAGSLQYEYRLVGVDAGWSQPVDHMSVNYANLPAGRLHFEVRSVTAEGNLGPILSGFDLSVEAPLWRRWWFLALSLTLAAAGARAFFNYRVRQLLAMERLRTRIATDLHDDIGASLTQISILSELARRGASRDVHADLAGIARELVEDMSDIVWAVNPRHDRFDALAHRMRRFASDTLADIELEFDAASLPAEFSVPLEYRRPLYLVFKEAAHNVARHSGATRAAIRIEIDHASLKLTVEDNGCGFDVAAPRDGEGLNSIQRRMKDVGGRAEWESKPGCGARFTATLPLHRHGYLPKLGVIFDAHHK
jgi:ligand-binding sensor domain-containing protein/two-component sensor histidine kinase